MTGPTLLLDTSPALREIFLAPLHDAAPHLRVVVQDRDAYDPASIDYLVSFRPPAGLVRSLPNVKVAFSLGAGVDGFLPDFPSELPLVRLVDATLSTDMAEYVVLQVLLHHRRQRAYDSAQHDKAWRPWMSARRTEDTRVGILGLGEIGAFVGHRLRALGFIVSGWSRTPKQIEGIESFAGLEALPALLGRSDFLVCVLPLTRETRGILDRDTFALLPKDAFVINIARGEHVVEADLLAALNADHLAGAALDVFAEEPLPSTSALWSHPKITITPHIAALSDARAVARNVIDGIARHRRGQPLLNRVDVARGY